MDAGGGVAVVVVLLAVACSDDVDMADTTQPAEPIGPEVAGIDTRQTPMFFIRTPGSRLRSRDPS